MQNYCNVCVVFNKNQNSVVLSYNLNLIFVLCCRGVYDTFFLSPYLMTLNAAVECLLNQMVLFNLSPQYERKTVNEFYNKKLN